MLHQNYVTQPIGGINYLSLFESALDHRPYDGFDVAVAYATVSGVKELTKACRELAGQDWERMQKRWLIGIDYCRTEPLAIRMLQAENQSTVKIHEGLRVVGRRNCTPILPFHPKAFLFRANDATAVVSGSGNLSRNGLTRGHEVGSLLIVRDPSNAAERNAGNLCTEMRNWFDGLWTPASSASQVLSRYETVFESTDNLKSPVPTDDDAGDADWLSSAAQRGALSARQLRQLRVCKRLWIEAGVLTKNRGPKLPGNQLMMSRMTRVFFGFSSTDLPRDSTVGYVSISYSNHQRHDCSLRFSNNSMDVLGLPIPDDGGPRSYDNECLRFERLSTGGFEVTIGSAAEIARWKRASATIDGLHEMRSGRQWGVY